MGEGAASAPGFGYFDHDADIGIEGRGRSIEEAFVEAARAMFSLPYDLSKARPERRVEFEFEEEDPELALVEWLNAALAASRVEELVPAEFELRRDGNRWRGTIIGSPISDDIDRGTEVKGATLTELAVRRENGTWTARCVVDV